jgi:hypothetical protein
MGKGTAADTYKLVYNMSLAAAQKAITDFGPEHTEALNCGSATVIVTPANHPFIRWCKKNGIGDKHFRPGWAFYCPGAAPVQQVDIHEAGAQAFAQALRNYLTGVEVVVTTRLT